MGQCGRRDEDEGARWKFNHQAELPEDKVAAFSGIKSSKGLDSAPAKRAAQDVAVFACPNIWPKVESSGRKRTSIEDSSELGHFFQENFEIAKVVAVQMRVPQRKAA